VLIHPWDAGDAEQGWEFLRAQGFGHLVAVGRGREVPVVVPTQFTVTGSGAGREVLLHLARANPVWAALAENPAVVLSVAGDWAYVPGAWKATDDEDPRLGIPTTYYTAVQLVASAEVLAAEDLLAVLRTQLADLEPAGGLADPSVHERRLPGILGLRLVPREIRTKLKYGGNVDTEHRSAVASRLRERDGPGDAAAETRLRRTD